MVAVHNCEGPAQRPGYNEEVKGRRAAGQPGNISGTFGATTTGYRGLLKGTQLRSHINSPAQYTQNQVEHEEASHYNQRNKKDPVEGASNGIVGLKITVEDA